VTGKNARPTVTFSPYHLSTLQPYNLVTLQLMPLSPILRAVRANLKLGWDIEGNWAPAWAYLFIALATPAAGVLMLVFIYLVVMGAAGEKVFLAYLMGGASVFVFVRLVLSAAGWAVIEDREHYKTLRYIYIAPSPFAAQLIGRIGFKTAIAAFGSALTIIAGWLALGVPFRPDGIQWLDFIGGFIVGLVGMVGMGWLLASAMLLVDRMGWVWAEGFSGLLFLVSGMAIPLKVLPAPLAWVGRQIPITYWAELWRHALYGGTVALSLPGMTTAEIWLRLLLSTMAWTTAAGVGLKLADYFARRWGKIESETFY